MLDPSELHFDLDAQYGFDHIRRRVDLVVQRAVVGGIGFCHALQFGDLVFHAQTAYSFFDGSGIIPGGTFSFVQRIGNFRSHLMDDDGGVLRGIARGYFDGGDNAIEIGPLCEHIRHLRAEHARESLPGVVPIVDRQIF